MVEPKQKCWPSGAHACVWVDTGNCGWWGWAPVAAGGQPAVVVGSSSRPTSSGGHAILYSVYNSAVKEVWWLMIVID